MGGSRLVASHFLLFFLFLLLLRQRLLQPLTGMVRTLASVSGFVQLVLTFE